MRKICCVTGANGFVGGNVIAQALGDWEVHALDQRAIPGMNDAFQIYQLDLRETEHLRKLFHRIQPDAVIHTAAMADIDACQSQPDMAEQVNVEITRNLAELCAESGTKLVFCSTDSIFDGQKGNYSEEDLPAPLNFYAETKVRAERIVAVGNTDAVIARLSLVMGLPVLSAGNSFMAKLIERLEAGQRSGFPENEIRTPIDVITLGRALVELAGNSFSGVIHLAGNDRLTRYEMACRIAQALGYAPDLIAPTDSSAMPDRAPRPRDVSLDNSKAKRFLQTPMRDLDDAIALILSAKETHQR